jgi:hypothetical protein
MRLVMFGKLMLISICLPLLYFGLVSGVGVIECLKLMAIGIVASVGITVVYPEIRGIKNGDMVAVVSDALIPSIIGKPGTAAADGRKNQKIKVILDNGAEVLGLIEEYTGLISPPRIKLIYEEKLVPGSERLL